MVNQVSAARAPAHQERCQARSRKFGGSTSRDETIQGLKQGAPVVKKSFPTAELLKVAGKPDASVCGRILPQIATARPNWTLDGCQPGQPLHGPPKKKSRVPDGKRDFKYWGG
jgi:hypothetical protein